jgi:hypothetical protein
MARNLYLKHLIWLFDYDRICELQGITRKEYKCNLSIIKNMNRAIIVHELRAGYISLIEFEIWRIQY